MKYNNGKSHNDFYNEPKEKLIIRAKEYSEGNKLLEELLLKMWNNNIKTVGCCIGHNKEDEAYIAYYLDNTPNTLEYTNILYELIYNIENKPVSLVINYNNNITKVAVYMDIDIRDIILKQMNNIFYIKNNNINNITNIKEIINEFKDKNTNGDITIGNKEIQINTYNKKI